MDRIEKELRTRPAYARGRAIAEEEIAGGRLGYREYGKLVPWWPDVADTLQERHQIMVTVVGACITDADVTAEAEGYNERMMEEFQRRFGGDVVADVYREIGRKRKKHK